MGFSSEFNYDLFISYAHLDDTREWVRRFHDGLKALVGQHLGTELSVWRDPKLSGSDVWAESIDAAFRNSAVFLSIVSPSYMTSDYCRMELKQFAEAASGGRGLKVAGKSRICKVMIMDVPKEQQAREFAGTMGHRFFEPNPCAGWTTQFLPKGLEHPDQRFWIALERTAVDIADVLKNMKDRGADQQAVQRPRDTEHVTVYLAEVTDDLEDDRYVLRSELEQWGVRVLPEHPLPRNASELRDVVRADLAVSDLSVHAIGRFRGKQPLGDERSITKIQYELAQQRAAKAGEPFDRVIWLAPSVDGATHEKHQQFLESLQMESSETPFELMQSGFDELKEFVLSRVRPSVNRRVSSEHSGNGALIYISGHPGDLNSIVSQEIVAHCRARNFDVLTSAIGGDDSVREGRDDVSIKYSDGLLILYGECPSDWVTRKALKARSDAARRREKPLAVAVYDGPPPEKEQLPFHFQDVMILDARDGDVPNCVDQFLDSVESKNTAAW